MQIGNNKTINKKFTLRKPQRGMVLILVLMVFALAAVIAGELSYESHREVRRTANILHANESYLFARAGETFAIQKLLADYTYDQRSGLKADYLSEQWAVESSPYEVDSAQNNDTGLDSGEFVQDDFLDENASSNALQDIGELVIIIEDLQGRFNVNNVQHKTQGLAKGEDQLANVINAVVQMGVQSPQFSTDNLLGPNENLDETALEEDGGIILDVPAYDLALALKDWVDSDDESAFAGGGEDNAYQQKTIAYQTANQAVADITELMAVKGFDQQDYRVYQLLVPRLFEETQLVSEEESELGYEQELENNFDNDDAENLRYDAEGNLIPELPSAELHWGGVKSHFTALPFPSKINVNTASAVVLQALFSSEQAAKIIAGREGSPYQSVDDIFLNITEIKAEDRPKYTIFLSVNSQYFLATSIATIGETRFTLRSKLYRDDKGEVRVLSRDFSQ